MPQTNTLQAIIDRTPGHRYFGEAWRSEPVDVEVTIFYNDVARDNRNTYSAEFINAVLDEYGPPVESDDEDAEGPTLTVPAFIADMLAFWGDEHTFRVDAE
jgi:hypothetical protein